MKPKCTPVSHPPTPHLRNHTLFSPITDTLHKIHENPKLVSLGNFFNKSFHQIKATTSKSIIWLKEGPLRPDGLIAQVGFPLLKLTLLAMLLVLIMMSTSVPIGYQIAILLVLVFVNILFSLDIAKSKPAEPQDGHSYVIRRNFKKFSEKIVKIVNPIQLRNPFQGAYTNLSK